jgi:hypothetical protein
VSVRDYLWGAGRLADGEAENSGRSGDNMKVMSLQGNQKVVEFEEDGVFERVLIPADAPLTKSSIKRGIAYGLTLDDVAEALGRFDRKEVARRLLNGLHRRGVWTKQDIRKPRAANLLNDALLEAIGVQVVELINLFEERG